MPTLQKNKSASPKFRPLGLLLALLMAALVYGLFPLLPLGMAALIRLRGHQGVNADIPAAFAQPNLWLGLVILVLCFLAWRGRPRWSRWALIGAVWLATAYHFYQIFLSLAPQAGGTQIGGDLTNITRSILPCTAIFLLLIPIYITWYMNRAPARAFYAPDV